MATLGWPWPSGHWFWRSTTPAAEPRSSTARSAIARSTRAGSSRTAEFCNPIQQPDGSKYLYGYNSTGFSNFASRAVREYNQDLAVEAVKAGFDDIVYDYVRRPDGPIAGMRFPGLHGQAEDAIVSFLAETRAKIRPLGGSASCGRQTSFPLSSYSMISSRNVSLGFMPFFKAAA